MVSRPALTNYVKDNEQLSKSLQSAAAQLHGHRRELVIVGVEPDSVAGDLGYIVPRPARTDGGLSVGRFVEKPDPADVPALLAAGAVWNTLIFAADRAALLSLLCGQCPSVAGAMWIALAEDERRGGKPKEGESELPRPRSGVAHAPLPDRSDGKLSRQRGGSFT
jgi:mannose-1-phosphate guanylyltransferase